jgi:hypothetical protein
VHIADKFVQRHSDDALTRGETGQVSRSVFGKERCSHAHDRHRRDLSNSATNLFENDCYFSETEASATGGFGHADSDDAEVGKFTPKRKVDAASIFDLFEMLHGATVGENAISETTQFFLI